MKIIIPMAGRGTRLRPHTLITPKPLLPVAGKPIVQRLVEDIMDIYGGKVEEIGFVIGDFGEAVEEQLKKIAADCGAKASIFHQEEPLGTAHAIWQAESCMDGEVVLAFADTLFRADFQLPSDVDGVIWVKTVSNPESFGVVTINDDGHIKAMVEKPTEFVSDMAIIGIYYLKDGPALRSEIKHLLDNKILGKGEYQLTDALENMRQKGAKFIPGKVDAWMDCGNKAAVLDTNEQVLKYDATASKPLVSESAEIVNSQIIPPCFIGEGVKIENSVIGPYVSVGNNTVVLNSVLEGTIIQENSSVENLVLKESMIGMNATAAANKQSLSIGDFSSIEL